LPGVFSRQTIRPFSPSAISFQVSNPCCRNFLPGQAPLPLWTYLSFSILRSRVPCFVPLFFFFFSFVFPWHELLYGIGMASPLARKAPSPFLAASFFRGVEWASGVSFMVQRLEFSRAFRIILLAAFLLLGAPTFFNLSFLVCFVSQNRDFFDRLPSLNFFPLFHPAAVPAKRLSPPLLNGIFHVFFPPPFAASPPLSFRCLYSLFFWQGGLFPFFRSTYRLPPTPNAFPFWLDQENSPQFVFLPPRKFRPTNLSLSFRCPTGLL